LSTTKRKTKNNFELTKGNGKMVDAKAKAMKYLQMAMFTTAATNMASLMAKVYFAGRKEKFLKENGRQA
jgi:uncharacterized protein YyaL (SSP411 family)